MRAGERIWRRRPERRRHLERLVLVSLLLHAVLIAIAVFWAKRRPPEVEQQLPSPVAMVFNPQPGRASTPNPTERQMPGAREGKRELPAAPSPPPAPPAETLPS